MTVAYVGRLICLGLAAFFLVHAVLAAIVSLTARAAVRRAQRLRPRLAARLLIVLRLLPAAAAGLLVAALCVPSYLLLEPRAATERLSPACLILAIFGAAICASGLFRGLLAAIRSARYLQRCHAGGAPMLLLAGIFRSRIVISPGVRQALAPAELEVALLHERAHWRARDNLKRLLLSIAPDALPFVRGFAALDAGWRRIAEWAADDAAVQGSPERALALASALVRVGRMHAAPFVPLTTSLIADGNDLSTRVERLLEGAPCEEPSRPILLLPAIGVALVAVALLQAPVLETIHRLLETLIA